MKKENAVELWRMKYKNNSQAEAMLVHVTACKASGQTVVAYCKEEGLSPSTFYYWQKRLKGNTASESGFTQIVVAAPEAAVATVHFPNGVRIVFSGGAGTSVLKELACCI